MAVSKMRCKAW